MTSDHLGWLHDLSDQELRLRAQLLDEVVQGVVPLGTDCRITCWNPAAERLFRIPAEEAHGGQIGVTSDGPGKGSTFLFTVPRGEPA